MNPVYRVAGHWRVPSADLHTDLAVIVDVREMNDEVIEASVGALDRDARNESAETGCASNLPVFLERSAFGTIRTG